MGAKFLCLVGISLLTAVIFGGCATYERTTLYREHREIASRVDPFDPAWFGDPQHRHMAVFFQIIESRLVLQERPAERRPGDMPYRPAEGGPVSVIYFDADGIEVGRHIMHDPILARSCALPEGPAGNVRPLNAAASEILLPDDERIAALSLRWTEQEGQRFDFDIRSQMARIEAPLGEPEEVGRK